MCDADILTDEQVENWRRVLMGMFGPYALIMSREQIQMARDKMQEWAAECASGSGVDDG